MKTDRFGKSREYLFVVTIKNVIEDVVNCMKSACALGRVWWYKCMWVGVRGANVLGHVWYQMRVCLQG